jgi:hypothetical protein
MDSKEELELGMAIGRLEGKTDALTENQNRLTIAVDNLSKALKRRVWYDSAKVVTGAFAGGFTAVFVKLGIWGS